MERTALMLSSNLNMSWFDLIALKWSAVLNEAGSKDKSIIKGSEFVMNLANISSYPTSGDFVEAVKDKNIHIVSRLAGLVSEMNKHRIDGKLPVFLSTIASKSKPGSPAIYRHVTKNVDQILKFAGLGISTSNNVAPIRKVS